MTLPGPMPSPSPDDLRRELAETLADPAAFRRWYEAMVVSVYRYLYPRCGGDVALAEDITQQTFITAMDRRATYEGRSSASTWLLTIARHKLADHYRRIQREDRRHLRLVVREIPAAQSGTPLASSVEDRERILAALRQLAPLQRAVVVLCYVDGLSVREAARELERSESATESLLGRARDRLRTILREDTDGR